MATSKYFRFLFELTKSNIELMIIFAFMENSFFNIKLSFNYIYKLLKVI